MVTFLKSVSVRQERGNVAKDGKYATQIFSFFRTARPATSVIRPAARSIMKFYCHVGRLQQAAHQLVEKFPRRACVRIPAQKSPPLTKKSATKTNECPYDVQPLSRSRLSLATRRGTITAISSIARF